MTELRMKDSQPTIASLLVDWIKVHIQCHPGTSLLFMSGAQGIGKSTALKAVDAEFAGRVASLSLDDFYLPQAHRIALSTEIAPQFKVRGPPGTHDLELLNSTIDALLSADDGSVTPIPVFDKRIDDRCEQADWQVFRGRPDAILLEGWCNGAQADPSASTAPPLNVVEASDTSGAWRAYQEAELGGPYSRLWDRADAYLHLCAQHFEQVLQWRSEQEETTLGLAPGELPDERRAWVADFIRHYERLTRRLLAGQRRRGYTINVTANRAVAQHLLPAPDVLVFSDLDGTLLDHETYSFQAASEALAALRARDIPLVLASSKTATEIDVFRSEMGFAHCPAIIENGAGILEAGAKPEDVADGTRDNICAALAAAPGELRRHFSGFNEWSIAEVARRTGLSLDAAARAKQRQFTEPGLWTGAPEDLAAFMSYLASEGIFAQRGGRFLTLSNGKTKADAMFAIASRYRPTPIIALGDAPNDLDMIEAAHRGVIIKNANGPKIERTAGETLGKSVRTTLIGPAGWNSAILELLSQLDT